jgi:hypothetical protein
MHARWAIFTLVLGSVLLWVGRARAEDPTEFAPKNGMYTITIPAGEKSTERTRVLTIRGRRIPVEAAQTTAKDGTSFLGASIGIPAVVMRDIPADKRFDILRDAIAQVLKGKVTDEKDITQDPVPGKEYQIELPKGVARMQVYTIAGWVIYAVVEGKGKEQVNSKEADDFYASLKLSDKAKDVFRQVKR